MVPAGNFMKQFRSALILGLGFFALVAQTLLFRDFLAAFEGSELGVGSFFGSWLLWVGLGAVLGRAAAGRLEGLARRFELTVLLYMPALLVQQALIADARALGGVPAYEVYPFGRMLAVSLVANAPISLVTGLLFTLACRWWEREAALPPARVYMVEALGSFLGGIGVTLLLARGLSAERIIAYAGIVLVAMSAIGWLAGERSKRSIASGGILLALLAALVAVSLGGLPDGWSRATDRARWSRLLAAEEFRGSFTTAQAKYLYGRHGGQLVVMSWGGVSETVPNIQHASEIIALGLSQHPTAKNALIVGGDSLSICLRLGKLPQIGEVVWLHPDPEYPRRLLEVLPAELKAGAERLHAPGREARAFLQSQRRRFDLVWLNLPDPTTLVLNHYWTREFFEIVRQSLADGGVVCARLTGAENFIGQERAFLGASALATLKSVFGHVVLKPGEESWLVASDGEGLSTAPAELRDRFAKIAAAAEVYPPEGLMSLYVPDRAEFQLEAYGQTAAGAPETLLLSRDERPISLFFSLLLALRRTTLLSFARTVPVLHRAGIWIAACPIVIYGLLRLLYMLAPRGGRATRE